MKRNNDRDLAYKNAIKVAKRVALTIVCCIPVLIIFAYLTRNIIKYNGVQILCFMLIMGVAVLIVEIIARKKEKVKLENKDITHDVFK